MQSSIRAFKHLCYPVSRSQKSRSLSASPDQLRQTEAAGPHAAGEGFWQDPIHWRCWHAVAWLPAEGALVAAALAAAGQAAPPPQQKQPLLHAKLQWQIDGNHIQTRLLH